MLLRVALVTGLLLGSRVVHAQDIEHARELFREASELREAGLYADAVDRLRQAIAIKDTPGLEYHAGFCESKLGHYRKAIRHYERAAELLRQGVAAPDVVSLLPPAHAAALEHIARLRIYVATSNADARMTLDGETEESLPKGDVFVDPGKHHLVFSAPGYVTEDREISVSEAEVLNIQVNLVTTSPTRRAATPARSSDFPWKTVSIGLGIGVTAGGLGLGIASAFQRREAQRQINFYLGNHFEANNPSVVKASDDKSSATRWETVGFVSAGVGAAATCALWAFWPSPKAVRVSVTPAFRRWSEPMLSVTANF